MAASVVAVPATAMPSSTRSRTSPGTAWLTMARASSASDAIWSALGGSSWRWRSVWRTDPMRVEVWKPGSLPARPVPVEHFAVDGEGFADPGDGGFGEPAGGLHALAEPSDRCAPVELRDAAVVDLGDQEAGGIGAEVDDADAPGFLGCGGGVVAAGVRRGPGILGHQRTVHSPACSACRRSGRRRARPSGRTRWPTSSCSTTTGTRSGWATCGGAGPGGSWGGAPTGGGTARGTRGGWGAPAPRL